jgi:hypothetical protein
MLSSPEKIQVSISAQPSIKQQLIHRALLWCGIGSSVLYVLMNVFIPLGFAGYSYADYTVSELSAVGAPTRTVWVIFAMFYILTFAGFGWSVLRSAGNNNRLRILGVLILAYCVVNIYWPPMHPRGSETSLTDTLHLVWAGVAVLFMMAMMGVGATTFNQTFRVYTISSMILLVLFGALVSSQAPNIPLNLPTPGLGAVERVMISIFLLWVVILSFVLLKRKNTDGRS